MARTAVIRRPRLHREARFSAIARVFFTCQACELLVYCLIYDASSRFIMARSRHLKDRQYV
ncbi:hypothetical protein PSAB6_60309 [Paraburkholderia sabiae]|nr:hypothetical protein PSAB6_60309 [Paraburkholderia sabiae]